LGDIGNPEFLHFVNVKKLRFDNSYFDIINKKSQKELKMQTLRFNDLIETIKSLSSEEKEEIKFLIERYLIEERREEIYQNYKDSLKELKEGKIGFTGDINKLKEMIEE